MNFRNYDRINPFDNTCRSIINFYGTSAVAYTCTNFKILVYKFILLQKVNIFIPYFASFLSLYWQSIFLETLLIIFLYRCILNMEYVAYQLFNLYIFCCYLRSRTSYNLMKLIKIQNLCSEIIHANSPDPVP